MVVYGFIGFMGSGQLSGFPLHPFISGFICLFDCGVPRWFHERQSFRKDCRFSEGTTGPQHIRTGGRPSGCKGSGTVGTDEELLRPVGIGLGWCGVETSGNWGTSGIRGMGNKKGCPRLRTPLYCTVSAFRPYNPKYFSKNACIFLITDIFL